MAKKREMSSHYKDDPRIDREHLRAKRRREIRAEYAHMYEIEQRRDEKVLAQTRDMRSRFYAGVDPRRRQEMADGGIIREDHESMANLPRRAIHHEYPLDGFNTTPYIDDTASGSMEMRDDDDSPVKRFHNVLNEHDR